MFPRIMRVTLFLIYRRITNTLWRMKREKKSVFQIVYLHKNADIHVQYRIYVVVSVHSANIASNRRRSELHSKQVTRKFPYFNIRPNISNSQHISKISKIHINFYIVYNIFYQYFFLSRWNYEYMIVQLHLTW